MQPAQIRILVIDDEACLADVVANALRKAGFGVMTASDGDEGFDLAVRQLPDLIVSDYQMPVATGLQMCARLYEDPRGRNVPVILLTARGHRLGPADLEGTNICEMMAKPFSAKQLITRVNEVLKLTPAAGAGGPQPEAEDSVA
jgi:two-component system phosphate regulon response regulator PhoB